MKESARNSLRLDRLLLALYLIALFGLLLLPISGVGSRFINMGGDKLIHIALFGGLSVILRWNFSATRNAVFKTVAIGFVIAAIAEIAQRLVAYRSAELSDVAAGIVGAILGAVVMNRALQPGTYDIFVGLVIAVLGLMVGALFVLADVIGLGTNNHFGPVQAAGTGLGALIIGGGAWVQFRNLRDVPQS